jgi:hypothetical protein
MATGRRTEPNAPRESGNSWIPWLPSPTRAPPLRRQLVTVLGDLSAPPCVKHHEFPGVQLALSATTALSVFQSQGYPFIPW